MCDDWNDDYVPTAPSDDNQWPSSNHHFGNREDRREYRGRNGGNYGERHQGFRGNNPDRQQGGYRGDRSQGFRSQNGDRQGFRSNNGDRQGFRPNNGQIFRNSNNGDRHGFRGNNGDQQGFRTNNGDHQGFRANNGDHQGFRAHNGDHQGFRGNTGEHQSSRGNNFGNENATFIKVPSKFVGRIIGRSGVKINDLQFESGARINVTKDTDGDQTVVKLIGDSEAVSKAESLIMELTVDRDNRSTLSFNSQPDYQQQNDNFHFQTEEVPVQHSRPENIDWKTLLKESDEMEKAQWAQLPEIHKFFYKEHPEISAMTDEEVAEFRTQSNNVVVERTFKTEDSKPIPKPVKTFEHAFHQYPEILEEIKKAGFTTPSPIQTQAWPILLSGEDLIGIAQTGTGKTLAFLLPALIHIDGQLTTRADRTGPAVLVMAPTRELALQIEKEVKKYEYKGIKAVCIYGGGNRREQINIVTKGVDIVIATPGRLNDLMQAGHLDVRYVTYAVLDEADRMLDMGFEPQIRKVMYNVRPTRQTVMTSATWPIGVRRLAQSYMVDPIQVYVGTLDLAATHTVTQIIEIMPDSDEEKYKILMDFVTNLDASDKVIVFCGKKARADELSSELSLAGINCQTLHGNREQSDREQAVADITDGTVQVLIATDVASRGLDIDDITHVINYDFPRNIEEYVHRVGRTGRAGKSGKSISYVTKADWGQMGELISILEEAEQYVPDEVYRMAERFTAWKEKKNAEKPAGRGGRPRFGGNRGGAPRW